MKKQNSHWAAKLLGKTWCYFRCLVTVTFRYSKCCYCNLVPWMNSLWSSNLQNLCYILVSWFATTFFLSWYHGILGPCMKNYLDKLFKWFATLLSSSLIPYCNMKFVVSENLSSHYTNYPTKCVWTAKPPPSNSINQV